MTKPIMVDLSIYERIMLPEVCPQKGNFGEAVVFEYLVAKLKITEADMQKYQIVEKSTPGGQVQYFWNPELDKGEKFELTQMEFELIKRGINNLDNQSMLPIKESNFIQMCGKFAV